MRSTWIPLAVAAVFASCHETTAPAEEEEVSRPPASAYINIVDEQNRPLHPDTVIWYRPEEAGHAGLEHPATCINAGCTRWAVPVGVSDSIYVSASWLRPVPHNDYCWYLGSDAKPVAASPVAPPTVTLTLNTKQEACE